MLQCIIYLREIGDVWASKPACAHNVARRFVLIIGSCALVVMLTFAPQAAIEDSEVASILLSVTPQFGPISAVTRGRTWSLDLGTLTLLCFVPCAGARD